MSVIYEHTSRDSCEEFSVALDDGRMLNIKITDEGIIMDVFERKPEYADQDEHLGTAGMMFDEWSDWVVADGGEEETTDINRKLP